MRKLTRTEANFENLLEAALLVEGHCSHAAHGCSCRGCDECEENYMMGSEEGEKESLADLIDRYVEGKPNTAVRIGEDPRADDEEYDEDQETFANLSQNQGKLANAMDVLRVTDPAREKALVNSAKDAAKRVVQTAVDALKRP
jgi:hypothetical protein